MNDGMHMKDPEDAKRDELIQRFVDGDLSPEEAATARELLSADPVLRREERAYRRLGDLLREAAGAEAPGGDLEGTWQRVSTRLGEAGGEDSLPSTARVWLGEFVSHRKRYWIPVAGAMAAAAAALVVVMNLPAVPDVPVKMEQAVDLRSRVTDISLSSASTMVIEVETGTGGTAAILWVTAEDEEPESEEPDDETGD